MTVETTSRPCSHCRREVHSPFLVCRACLEDIFIGPRPEPQLPPRYDSRKEAVIR